MFVKFSWRSLFNFFTSLLMLFSFFLFSAPAHAQNLIGLSEDELVFRGLVGETLQRTVTIFVQRDNVFSLQYVISDLVDQETKNVILSEQVSLNPSDLSQLTGNQVVTITISNVQKFGAYNGYIEFIPYGETEAPRLRLNLVVYLEAVPMVDADVNSKNPILFVEPSLFDVPFGRPETSNSSPKLGEVVLSMVQSGDSPARILNAKVLAMQSAQGRTLPEDAVQVNTQFPINLEGRDAATIRISARGRNLPAGEYNGTLLVNVENQPGPVQIPLKVQVKDGPILAFILLCAGPLVGVLFFYWNKDGKSLIEIQQRIRRLQSILKSSKFLCIQNQQEAKSKLDAIMDEILQQGNLSEVTNRITELEEFIKAQQTMGEQYSSNILNQIQRLEAMPTGKLLRDQMIESLKKLRLDVETGNAPNWEFVEKSIANAQVQIEEMEAIVEEVKAIGGERQTVLQKRLDEARNMDEFRSILAEGRSILPRQLVELFTSEEAGSRPDWQRFSLVLQWRRLAVAAVVYLLTLFVGWITLYASSPTFGANREDYITLFLWGVASNMVGGQSVDLKSILTRSPQGLTEPEA